MQCTDTGFGTRKGPDACEMIVSERGSSPHQLADVCPTWEFGIKLHLPALSLGSSIKGCGPPTPTSALEAHPKTLLPHVSPDLYSSGGVSLLSQED